jgi:enolase-phosphatase E1
VIKAIVCDIEGTTTSLSFVKDTLFPYTRQRMAGFIEEHYNDPAVAPLIDDVKNAMDQPHASLHEVAAQLIRWIDEDKKITPLKAIQGLIWESGYQQGDYHGHLYDDAYQRLKQWHDAGIGLYIFSSGSVYAQKLLFSHSRFGDLTPLFSGYFDTNIGAKQDADAYHAIADRIGRPASEIMFLSDIDRELDAAKAAGFRTVWLVRDGPFTASSRHPQVGNFHDIAL